MLCADDWLFGESLLVPEDLEVGRLAEVEAGRGEAVEVDRGAGRAVGRELDVGAGAGAGVVVGGAAVAAVAARCAAQCDSEHSGRPQPRAWDRWLDRVGRVARTAIDPAGQGPAIVAGRLAGKECSVAGCQAQGSWTFDRPWSRMGRAPGGGRTVAVSIHLSVSTDNRRVSTRAQGATRMRRERVLPFSRICTLDD